MAIQALNRQAQNRYTYKPGGIYECKIWPSGNRHVAGSTTNGLSATLVATDSAVEVSSVTEPTTSVSVKTHAERSKMTTNATQEKGLMLYTITLELSFDYDGDLLALLNSYRGKALGAKVTVNNKGSNSSETADTDTANSYLVGLDAITGFYDGTAYWFTDYALFLDSVEADSGAKLADGTMCTAKFTAVQATPPALFV
tara:strand:- start:2294 stop:2890 length:597 start_codon:yes stop_codon:yes gene_type:complete